MYFALNAAIRQGRNFMLFKYVWQDLYSAAIVETDGNKMPTRVQESKSAIDSRLHELQLDRGGTIDERQAINDALEGLNVLRREIERRADKKGVA
jgi:hypothetical protein